MFNKYVWAFMLAWALGTVWLADSLVQKHSDLKYTQQELKEVQDAYTELTAKRQALQQELRVSTQVYLEALKINEDTAADTISKHLSDNKRLRVRLSDSRAECSGSSSDRPDAYVRADIHRETAEALIRITQDADSHVKALQATIILLTKPQE